MKKILVIAFCSVQFVFIGAQKHKFLDPLKFNDVDLSKQKSALDENAPAEILYKSLHFSIDHATGNLIKNTFYRVKIYDKDKAEDWLNLEIPLYQNGGDQETLSKIKAFTYNLENGTAVATKVDKSSKYKSKESKYISINKFAFPNVKNGSVIEYQYEVTSPFGFNIPEILIETDTPSLYTEYILDSPSSVAYNLNYTGSLLPKYKEVDERLLYGMNYRTYRFAYENLKAFKTEKFVNNDRNYRTKIGAELHSTNFRELKMYSSSWEQIKDRIYEREDFGGELKKTKLAKENMPANVAGISNELDKSQCYF